MKQISLKEICYYLFFSLIFMAKGMGLYDGQTVFKVILIAALLFWIGKMIVTSYSLKEFFVIGMLLVLGGLSYYYSKDKAALIAVMTIVGMKDIPAKRLFKVGLVVWAFSFCGTITATFLGLKDSYRLVHNKAGMGFIIRDSLGMTHPNVLHISYMILIALWFVVFNYKGKRLKNALALSLLGSIYIFIYSLSYTGFIFVVFYLVMIAYLHLRRKRTVIENIILQCWMPFIVLISVLGPILLKGKIFELINKAVNTRFELSRHYLTTLRPTLFGTMVNTEGNYTIDCSYVHCLYYYGIVLFLLFVIGYFLLIRNLMKKERNQELAMTLELIAAGFTEPFLFNFSGKNLTFILLGEMVFDYLSVTSKIGWMNKQIQICKKDFVYQWMPDQRIGNWRQNWIRVIQKYKKQLWGGIAIGILAGAILGNVFIHVDPYVVVNKNTSDRVGKKGDYKIYQELSDEIKLHSLKINVNDENDKVFVLSGSIIKFEEIREKITVCVYGGILVISTEMLILIILQRGKRNDENSDVG